MTGLNLILIYNVELVYNVEDTVVFSSLLNIRQAHTFFVEKHECAVREYSGYKLKHF